MSAVATSSKFATPFKRPRTSSSDENDGYKKAKYFYVLAPESTDEAGSDGSESVCSLQGQTTDLAKDTSDTSSSSGDVSVVEFEVVSVSDEPVYPFPGNESSSSPVDIFHCQPMSLSDSDSESGRETSNFTSENLKDCGRRLYLFVNCVQCGNKNPLPYVRYCNKCYKVRKNFFPPRPKGKRKTWETLNKQNKFWYTPSDAMKLSGDSGIGSEGSQVLSDQVREEKARSDSKGEGDSDSKDLCNTCLAHPKNGGYVHKNIVHVYSCYKCSVKIMKHIGRCPICNLRVNQVCKVITF